MFIVVVQCLSDGMCFLGILPSLGPCLVVIGSKLADKGTIVENRQRQDEHWLSDSF